MRLRTDDRREQRPVASSEEGEAPTWRARALWTWPTMPRALWPRFAAAASLAAVAVMVVWLPSANVSATPDFVLDRARVSERSWRYQPGKVRRWVTESDIRGNPLMPDGRYRTLWWQSNVEGQTGEILRRYDEKDRLVFGRWTKSDGRDAYFSDGDKGSANRLTIHPSPAALGAVLPSLPVVQQDAVRRYLQERPYFLSPQMQGQSFGDWLVDAAEGRKPNRTIERRTTPEWGTVYYLRSERRRDGSQSGFESWVARFVDEQYIGLSDFRPYRRRTTRYNERGDAVHVEDSRVREFSDSTLEEFRAEDLDFDGALPTGWTVVRQTPEQRAAEIARTRSARPATTDAPKPPASRNK